MGFKEDLAYLLGPLVKRSNGFGVGNLPPSSYKVGDKVCIKTDIPNTTRTINRPGIIIKEYFDNGIQKFIVYFPQFQRTITIKMPEYVENGYDNIKWLNNIKHNDPSKCNIEIQIPPINQLKTIEKIKNDGIDDNTFNKLLDGTLSEYNTPIIDEPSTPSKKRQAETLERSDSKKATPISMEKQNRIHKKGKQKVNQSVHYSEEADIQRVINESRTNPHGASSSNSLPGVARSVPISKSPPESPPGSPKSITEITHGVNSMVIDEPIEQILIDEQNVATIIANQVIAMQTETEIDDEFEYNIGQGMCINYNPTKVGINYDTNLLRPGIIIKRYKDRNKNYYDLYFPAKGKDGEYIEFKFDENFLDTSIDYCNENSIDGNYILQQINPNKKVKKLENGKFKGDFTINLKDFGILKTIIENKIIKIPNKDDYPLINILVNDNLLKSTFDNKSFSKYIRKTVRRKNPNKNESNYLYGIINDYRLNKENKYTYYAYFRDTNQTLPIRLDQIVNIEIQPESGIDLNEPEPFRINLFDVLDKIKQPELNINIRHYRLRQLFTFCQLPIYDTIHDMVVGGNLKDYKNLYFYDILKGYRDEMFNLITNDDIKNIGFNLNVTDIQHENIKGGISSITPGVHVNTERPKRTTGKIDYSDNKREEREIEFDNVPVKEDKQDKEQINVDPIVIERLKANRNLKNLKDLDMDSQKKLDFIKQNIYPNWDKKDNNGNYSNPDCYMIKLFTLTEEDLKFIRKTKINEVQQGYISEDLGANISNIFPIQALEILGIRPFGFNKLAQYKYSFMHFLDKVQLYQQEFREPTKKVVTTFDTIGQLSNLTNITGLLKKEIDTTIFATDIRTPAKNYDSAWIFDEIFDKTKETIKMTGNTKYKIFFNDQNANINNHKFAKFDLLDGGKSLKLYYFGDYHFSEGLQTKDFNYYFSPKSSSNRHVSIKIAECYNNFTFNRRMNKEEINEKINEQSKIVRFMSFFKFGGDFIQGIWQYILAYPSYFKTNEKYQNFYNQCNLNGLKLHIATDTLSACISSLFGGVVVTSNTQFRKLENLQYGGTEFFFLNEELYNIFNHEISESQLLEYCVSESIYNIYKCEKMRNGQLTWENFRKNINRRVTNIIENIILTYQAIHQGKYESIPDSDNCNNERMNKYFKDYYNPTMSFGKKRVKELCEDYKYLLKIHV
jgi:hypothetical protein